MALTQIQIIQSLAEAMNWLERELSWGVAILNSNGNPMNTRSLGSRIIKELAP